MPAKVVRYPGGPREFQQDPYWLMLVVPYADPDSLDRSKLFDKRGNGFTDTSNIDGQPKEILENTILLDSEITTFTVTTSKASHIGQLDIQCSHSYNAMDILQWVTPGDWCLFWAFDNVDDYLRIKTRLVNKYKAQALSKTPLPRADGSDVVNDYYSGLKFTGKVSSVRINEARNPDSGQVAINTSIQAFSFTELDAIIYYNDLIRYKYSESLQFYNDLGVKLVDIFKEDKQSPGAFINNNMLVPALLQILLGQGPGKLTIDKGSNSISVPDSGLRDTPNVQYSIPQVVGQILYSGTGNKRANYYSDVLSMLVGIQEYEDGKPSEDSPWKFLVPKLSKNTPQTQFTNKPLDDKIIVLPFDFRDRSVWEILNGYVNRPLNEIYTAIRPFGDTGRLRPSFIFRRVPLSTDQYTQKVQTTPDFLAGTAFTNLPVWLIPSAAVHSYDLGRSDTARINYVHVIGTDPVTRDQLQAKQLSIIMAPPIVDGASIARNGLRMFNGQVPGYTARGSSTSNDNVAAKYTTFMADILLDGHMRFNGTMNCLGIQEPIAPGDNCIINGILFHIEHLIHVGTIDANGVKSFTTAIQASHGLPVAAIQRGRSLNDKQATANLASKTETNKKVKENLERMADQLRRATTNVLRDERNERKDLEQVKLLGATADFTPADDRSKKS